MRESHRIFVDPRADGGRRYRILVVDDEPEILSLVRRYVEASLRDASVITAPDGVEALRILRAGGIDLLLTDQRMPGMDGYTLLTETRKLYPAMPAMMMTAHGDLDLATRAINEAEIAKFLPKPFDLGKLAAGLRSALDKLRAEEMRRDAFQSMMQRAKG